MRIIICSSLVFIFLLVFSGNSCTKEYPFDKIPNAIASGLVLKYEKIDIQGDLVDRPFNPSILELPELSARSNPNSKYLLSFRQDIEDESDDDTLIGIVELDSNFKQSSAGVYYLRPNTYRLKQRAEDARLFAQGNQILISYNDLLGYPTISRSDQFRKIFQANLVFKNDAWQTENEFVLDTKSPTVEKNWVPFVDNSQIFYAYDLKSHWILEEDVGDGVQEVTSCPRPLSWAFGSPRGGGPAVLDSYNQLKYLAFFHSAVTNQADDFRQFVWGAYTFEPSSPYCLTSMSEWPIDFPGMYDAPSPKVPPGLMPGISGLRVAYPTSFVSVDHNGKPAYVASLGVGDAQCSLVWLDQEKLFESLKAIK